jgi:non-ribosomal peptide synthetase component F
MLPLRCDLSGDPSFTELVRRVRDVALGAYRHESVPFDRLVEELKPVRDPGRAPVFQVLLNMAGYADAWTVPSPGLDAQLLDLQIEPSMLDMTLSATELADGIRLRAVYKVDLFEAATIQQLLRRLETLVSGAVEHPDTPISALPLTAADERSALAGAFSADLEDA